MEPGLPHFAVIGAQKSGTTSLCAFLETLDDVCLSRPKEPMFFSRDEVALHPHFFATHQQEWLAFDWETHSDTLLKAYAACFAHRTPGQLCGEGSTSYLLSHEAPKRLFATNPHCKLICVLRDPASRAYSAYWHYVSHSIACEPFARHLQYEGGHTIAGGEYMRHLAHWLEYFPREQLHLICYEALLAEPHKILASLCDFLGVICPADASLPRENSGRTPRLLMLQLLINRLRRLYKPQSGAFNNASQKRDMLAPIEAWNLAPVRPAPMPQPLHHTLDVHYRRANTGLDTLMGLDLNRFWYHTL